MLAFKSLVGKEQALPVQSESHLKRNERDAPKFKLLIVLWIQPENEVNKAHYIVLLATKMEKNVHKCILLN